MSLRRHLAVMLQYLVILGSVLVKPVLAAESQKQCSPESVAFGTSCVARADFELLEVKPTLPQRIVDELVPGLVAGVVTTFFIFVVLQVWDNSVTPWFEKRVYSGLDLNDTWQILADGKPNVVAEAAVVQSAHRLTGTITWTKPGQPMRKFHLEGEFKDLIVTARYQEKDGASIDRGTVTLSCKNGGSLLEGYYAWYDVDSSDITSGKYQWFRKGSPSLAAPSFETPAPRARLSVE